MPPLTVFESQHSLLAHLDLDAKVTNTQDECLLFCTLPHEIRTEIFSLALLSYDDLTRPYPLNAYYHRPGHTHYQLIDTALLVTCRRVYRETHDLPLAQNKHVFWARDKYCTAPGLRSVAPNRYFQRMTLEQRAAVQCVHVFGPLRWFDDTILPILRALEVHPRSIKITHIHSNLYWTQERNSRGGPAKMVSTIPWARMELQEMTRLERLEIESEVMSQYEPLLEEATKTLVKYTLNLPKGRVLTANGNEVTRMLYTSNVEVVPVLDKVINTYSWRRRYISGQASARYVVIRMVWTAKHRWGTPLGRAVPRNPKV